MGQYFDPNTVSWGKSFSDMVTELKDRELKDKQIQAQYVTQLLDAALKVKVLKNAEDKQTKDEKELKDAVVTGLTNQGTMESGKKIYQTYNDQLKGYNIDNNAGIGYFQDDEDVIKKNVVGRLGILSGLIDNHIKDLAGARAVQNLIKDLEIDPEFGAYVDELDQSQINWVKSRLKLLGERVTQKGTDIQSASDAALYQASGGVAKIPIKGKTN